MTLRCELPIYGSVSVLPWSVETRLKTIYTMLFCSWLCTCCCCLLFLSIFLPRVSVPSPPYFVFLASINGVILTLLIFLCLPFENSPSFRVLTTPQSRLMIFCQIILHTYAYNCPVIMIIASTWDCHNYYCYTVVELVFRSITSSGNTSGSLYLRPYRLRCALI